MNMSAGLVLEAMDCVIVEVFDVYSKFCNKIAGVLMRIYDVGGKMEACVGLKVLQKAIIQGDELDCYIEYCRDIGVLNASQCPKIERISKEDIQDLERVISGAYNANIKNIEGVNDGVENKNQNKAIVVRDSLHHKESSQNGLTTVITHEWEVFFDETFVDDDFKGNSVINGEKSNNVIATNPFEESYSLVPYYHVHVNQVLPDLISL
ncbi:hypothetical protein RYX36_035485 [Vicia faba]